MHFFSALPQNHLIQPILFTFCVLLPGEKSAFYNFVQGAVWPCIYIFRTKVIKMAITLAFRPMKEYM